MVTQQGTAGCVHDQVVLTVIPDYSGTKYKPVRFYSQIKSVPITFLRAVCSAWQKGDVIAELSLAVTCHLNSVEDRWDMKVSWSLWFTWGEVELRAWPITLLLIPQSVLLGQLWLNSDGQKLSCPTSFRCFRFIHRINQWESSNQSEEIMWLHDRSD